MQHYRGPHNKSPKDGKFWLTPPRFQRPRYAFSSNRSTWAFGFKLGRALRPLSLTCNKGRYSRNDLFQKKSTRTFTCLHFLRWNCSVLSKEPGRKQTVFLCIMKWEGMIGWRSCGLCGAWSVTPQLDHLAATIFEHCETHYEILYDHWVGQLEKNRTCVQELTGTGTTNVSLYSL